MMPMTKMVNVRLAKITGGHWVAAHGYYAIQMSSMSLQEIQQQLRPQQPQQHRQQRDQIWYAIIKI